MLKIKEQSASWVDCQWLNLSLTCRQAFLLCHGGGSFSLWVLWGHFSSSRGGSVWHMWNGGRKDSLAGGQGTSLSTCPPTLIFFYYKDITGLYPCTDAYKLI